MDIDRHCRSRGVSYCLEGKPTAEVRWPVASAERPMWFTFDCYGTLIDWESGMKACFEEILAEKGSRISVEQFARDWEETQFQMIQGRYRPYREILAGSLLKTLAKHGLPAGPSDGVRLAESLPSWRPFPEVNPVLEELRKAGLLLAILSNIDDALLAQTVKHFGVRFDRLLTAEQARAYKPGERVFRYALEQLACPPQQIVHVAFGERYDLARAQKLGFRTVFINRHARPLPPGLHPEAEYRDLRGLLEFIALQSRAE